MVSCETFWIFWVAIAYASLVSGRIYLEPLSTTYLPYEYDPNINFRYSYSSVEQIAFDPKEKLIYSVGSNIIQVLDASNPANVTKIYHLTLGDVEITDVEFCGNHIFTTQDDLVNMENGTVVIYEKFNRKNNNMTEVLTIIVGSLPDMLRTTSDCLRILVAIEGEAFQRSGEIIDPEGGVGIIEFNPQEKTGIYTFVDFRKFNNRFEEYVSRGVRFVYRENNNTFSQDIEPEYITLNHDESLAYVSLQENNAIAVLDIAQKNIKEIYGLGEKIWKKSAFDASDYDEAINIRPWDIYSNYLPDAIDYLKFNGEDYILSANEGDDKDYGGAWHEESRVNRMLTDGKIGITDPEMLAALLNNTQLGRLTCSTIDGVDQSSGLITKLYTYGGRSFSIWRASDMSLVYDSGDEIEHRMSEFHPYIFNGNGIRDWTPMESRDTRSDNKGPECEMITTATINGKQVIFVGSERPGTITLFSFTTDITDIQFESIYSGLADPYTNKTWSQLYDDRETGDIDPEDIRFISAEDSPNGEPLLLVAGSVTGTVSLYAIKDTDPNPTVIATKPTTTGPISGSRAYEDHLATIILDICFCIILTVYS